MAAHTALYKRMMHVCMCVSFYICPHAYTSERLPLYIPHSYNLLQAWSGTGIIWLESEGVGHMSRVVMNMNIIRKSIILEPWNTCTSAWPSAVLGSIVVL